MAFRVEHHPDPILRLMLGEGGAPALDGVRLPNDELALYGGDFRLRMLTLADLGQPEDQGAIYDLCYAEDADSYIDIILIGDEAAARSITHVEVPAEGDYLPFHNPGGPGPTPFPDVRYTAPGPPDLEPVIIALDDPMRVSTG